MRRETEGQRAMMKLRGAAFAVLLCCPVLGAQEVRYIDLTAVEQRTELRYPPAPPSAPSHSGLSSGVFSGGGIGTGADGAPDFRDPHALGVYLTHRTESQIDPTQSFQVEFKLVNTGTAPIAVPVSPHLSDLQPPDPSVPFKCLSLQLIINVVEDPRPNAFVQLYGGPDHDGTMVTLQPGEWIRVTANVKLSTTPAPLESGRLRARFALQRISFYLHPGGSVIEAAGLYPNATPTSPLRCFGLEEQRRRKSQQPAASRPLRRGFRWPRRMQGEATR